MIKTIGVLTSGGDAPGMNSCVRAVVRTAIYNGIECYGIRRGYNGLISGDVVHLNEKNVSHIINRGGTVLGSARLKEFASPEVAQIGVDNLNKLGIDGIKIHMLHIIENTDLADYFKENPFHILTKEEYVDMVASGILDPVKVTRSALQNATSVASTLLTTESAVANIKEDLPPMPQGGMGGMM